MNQYKIIFKIRGRELEWATYFKGDTEDAAVLEARSFVAEQFNVFDHYLTVTEIIKL